MIVFRPFPTPEGILSFPEVLYRNVAEVSGFPAYVIVCRSPGYLWPPPTFSTENCANTRASCVFLGFSR